MNNKLWFVFGFGVGICVGVGAVKNHFARIAQEEIDSVKKVYSKRAKKPETPEVTPETEKNNMVAEYLHQLKTNGYADEEPYRNINEVYDPYVILPEQFGEREDEGYTTVGLTYYADGTLTDDMNHPLSEEEINDIIGNGNLERFGEHEEDSLHVRNDRLKCDYEILGDTRSFEEALDDMPYLRKEIEEEV